GTNGVDADFDDDLQSRTCRIKRRNVRRAVQKAPGIISAIQMRAEGKWLLMGHPTGNPRSEFGAQFRPHPQERRARTAAQPFQAAADIDIDAESPNIDWNCADGLVAIDDCDRSHGLRAFGNRLNVMDVRALAEHVRQVEEGG